MWEVSIGRIKRFVYDPVIHPIFESSSCGSAQKQEVVTNGNETHLPIDETGNTDFRDDTRWRAIKCIDTRQEKFALDA